jgi:eukaryotic-like serine/threonine-protein kinase
MGEVYKARDTRLDRDVAIKILPEAFAADADRVARFQREAKTLAALNHPHIAQIFGLEQAGGVYALAMELVVGEDLSNRIARGPIPIDEALPIAKQIADALEAAHEQGIIHRDLKPANIKVRDDGTVKVLDFGLAKALEPTGAISGNVSMSPTITSPAMTQAGIILGTAAYMAPEQARGKAVDKRADIWAFGCVLFEMMTRRRAFEGEDTTDTLAFVITKEPDWGLLPPKTPLSIHKVLTRCLQKDRSRRLRDIGDVRLELDEATGEAGSQTSGARVPNQSPKTFRRRVFTGISIATVSMALAAVGTAVWMRPAPQKFPALQRLTIVLPDHVSYPEAVGTSGIAISPDGTHIAYPAVENGNRLLYLRRLDQLEGRPMPGTDNATSPFFSPDGEWIAFFTYEGGAQPSNKLKKVAVRGGPPQTICDAPIPPGGSWGPDDNIVFASGHDGSAPISLLQVPAAGGTPKPLLVPDPKKSERRFAWPDVLPGGKAVLLSASASAALSFGDGHIAVLSLENSTVRTIIDHGFHARYVPTGHIIYMVGSQLMAVPFDVNRLKVAGPPVPLVAGVHALTNVGEASFAVSQTGFLIYAPGSDLGNGERTLAWVDREGHEQPIAAPPRAYAYPRLSPDGSRIALDARDQENDIWTFDIARGTLTRFTVNPGVDNTPVWTPDGSRIAFASDKDHAGTTNLYIAAADNSGQPARLTSNDSNNQFPMSFSSDGTRLVFQENDPKTTADLHVVAVDGDHRVTPLLHTPFVESNGVVSPDGRWLAYQTTESGQFQIYVRPFPNVDGGLHQVSTNGGTRPVWARNGRELFYMSGTGPVAVMAVSVELGTNFVAGTPQRLFEGMYYVGSAGRTYDPSPDGRRFLVIKATSTSTSAPALSQFVFVNNWFEELNRLVPTK